MRDIAKEVGDLIRNQRKAVGLSQEALAAKSKIDRSYMGRIERGEVNITIKSLWDISIAIGVPARLLIPE